MAFLCCDCYTETPFEHEARLSREQLKSDPVQIWWHRRRIQSQPSSLLANVDGSDKDLSPFPKSWSMTNSDGTSQRAAELVALEEALTVRSEESSVFSTVSQEQRLKRDALGNCLKHPQIQLARRRRHSTHSNHQLRSRLSRMFSKHDNSSTRTKNISNSSQSEEWDILLMTCPQCEKEHIERSKAQYHYKPKEMAEPTHQQLNGSGNSPMIHQQFPATLTLINSHPHFSEATLALRVRTDSVPTDQTMTWSTPNGALDFIIPADANGEIMKGPRNANDNQNSSGQFATPKTNNTKSSRYQIMERIIPIPSIDHVSPGGDAWDVLRQSNSFNVHGRSCDVKIHGFSECLLRFDVLEFDTVQSYGGTSHAETDSKRHTRDGSQFDRYTKENVISKLNSVVGGARAAKKTGIAYRMSRLNYWFEEYLGLGVHKFDADELDFC